MFATQPDRVDVGRLRVVDARGRAGREEDALVLAERVLGGPAWRRAVRVTKRQSSCAETPRRRAAGTMGQCLGRLHKGTDAGASSFQCPASSRLGAGSRWLGAYPAFSISVKSAFPRLDHLARDDATPRSSSGRQRVHQGQHEVLDDHRRRCRRADLALQGRFGNGLEGVVVKRSSQCLVLEHAIW